MKSMSAVAKSMIGTSDKVILISECTYLRFGFRNLLSHIQKELHNELVYVEMDYENTYGELVSQCSTNTKLTIFCDTRSHCFSSFFETIKGDALGIFQECLHWKSEEHTNASYHNLKIGTVKKKSLTEIEKKIINLLMLAWKPKEISIVTGLDVKRISFYKRNAMKKIGASNIHELFRKYYTNGLIKNIAIFCNTDN